MSWGEFEDELARRRKRPAGRRSSGGATTMPARSRPALKQAVRAFQEESIPLALAVVPKRREPGALQGCCTSGVTVLQHGTDHRNRAARGRKENRVPGRRADRGRAGAHLRRPRPAAHFRRASSFPVLAPPWNRMRKDLLTKLPAIGIRGVSGYGARASAEPAPGPAAGEHARGSRRLAAGRRFVGETEALTLAIEKPFQRRTPGLAHAPRGARRSGVEFPRTTFHLCGCALGLGDGSLLVYSAGA